MDLAYDRDAREIELKILLGPGQESRLRKAAALKAMAVGRPVTQTLVSIYYDTPDQALRAAKIALRLRRKGRRWLQTVKRSAAPIAGGLAQPLEDERQVTGQNLALEQIGQDDLREEVIGLARDGVAPVSETRLRRTTRLLKAPSGALVELAIDIGEVIADGKSAPLVEAELELKEGTPGDLYAVAAELFREGPIRFSNHAKSARAQMLAEKGYAVEPLEPVKAAPVKLARGDTAEHAALMVLGECLGQAIANLPVTVLTEHIEGPHQLRIGLRRLRSALSAFRPALGRAALAEMSATAQRIGTVVSELRDMDVLAEEMVAPLADDYPDEPGFAALAAAVEVRREAVRAQVCQTLCGPEVTRFVFSGPAFLASRGWLDPADHGQTARLAQPVEKLACRMLDKRWKALDAYGRRAAKLTIEERHEMRKEIKKIRYVGEIFESLFPTRRVKAFRSALKNLQNDFGALNDVAMAEAYLTDPGAPGADDPAAQRAAGRLIGAALTEADRLWPEVIADWKALKKTGPFWR